MPGPRIRGRARPLPVALVAAAALAGISGPTLAASAPSTATVVDLAGRTALAKVVSPTVLRDTGTLNGSPIGSGQVTLVYTLYPETGLASTTFTIANAHGTVTGTARSAYSVTRLHITFTGTGSITGGTRAYAGIRGRMLEFNALHSITGRREVVTLTGRATRP